jgi:4-hydroxy-3-methylbut-2-enyl diphosphate reductase
MKRKINLYLAEPRSFCAGVSRAIKIVEKTIEKYSTPIYVRHEIVHNKHVIETLKNKGAIFVDSIDEIKDKSRPVIFSAHGVAIAVKEKAINMGFTYIDAVCPLVSKVHNQAKKYEKENIKTILIGKEKHPEVIGTKGQIKNNNITIISNVKDVEKLEKSNEKIAYICQTTLSIDEVKNIVEALENKFPNLIKKKSSNVCYATTNRQNAVKEISKKSDLVIVIGSQNSSNSKKLKKVAETVGKTKAILIDDASSLDFDEINDSIKNIGITAGASAPEILVENLISKLKEKFEININIVTVDKENLEFSLPKELKD